MAKKSNSDKVKTTTETLLKEFLTQLGLDAEIAVAEPQEQSGDSGFSYLTVSLIGDNLGELIGYRGNMLDSIQTIISLMLTKSLAREGVEQKYRILLDINNYRQEREKYLISYAQRAVEEVIHSGQPMELSPMKPSERRIIHMALKDAVGVETTSAGEGESRRVVITPKNK